AIPGMFLDGLTQCFRSDLVVLCTFAFAARLDQRFELLENRQQEPTYPDTFALTARTYHVHSIVPVATAHEGQTMRTKPEAMLNGAQTVFVERAGLRSNLRQFVALFFVSLQRWRVQEVDVLVKDAVVAGGSYVVTHGERQP